MSDKGKVKSEVFSIDELPETVGRPGKYFALFQELKDLAKNRKGKIVEFVTRGTGVQAAGKIAGYAAEVNYLLYTQLHADGRSRYIWVKSVAQAKRDGDVIPKGFE